MAKRSLLTPPKPMHRRTREPEARWVYERCHAMWSKRNFLGDEPGDETSQGQRGAFTRGLQRFEFLRRGPQLVGLANALIGTDYEFIIEVEGGEYRVIRAGADYCWKGSVGLPRIPDDEELIEIKLAI